MRHNKWIIYFKNIYKTDLAYATVWKETQKGHTCTVDGLINGVGLYPGGLINGGGLYPGGLINGGELYPGGLISGIIYSFANGGLISAGGLKTGGGPLKWDFTVC